MTITESRLKDGMFTLGTTPGTEFACQATNVRVTPSYDDDGDAVETLCGDEIPAGKKESWVLAGTVIQDFDDPDGFQTYCFDNAMDTVDFEWVPNVTAAPTYSGQCVIVATEEGGDVNARLTVDFEFDVVGRVLRTPKAGSAATGATAGTPGTWTPSGSTPPADLAACTGLTASPATAWTTGQYVATGDSAHVHWDSAAWVTGAAP